MNSARRLVGRRAAADRKVMRLLPSSRMMAGVTEQEGGSAEQHLHDAVARWNADTGYGLADLVDAACQALIDGLDSPALRELAGASVNGSSWDIRELVAHSFYELDIPFPGTVAPGFAVAAGGGVARRFGVDLLRLEVVAVGEPGDGFQVRLYVNDAEMTSAGAGLGMDPTTSWSPAIDW